MLPKAIAHYCEANWLILLMSSFKIPLQSEHWSCQLTYLGLLQSSKWEEPKGYNEAVMIYHATDSDIESRKEPCIGEVTVPRVLP
ncbi:hypothetical protein QL285_073024 [Trifolium repens]|nr:hypothetical protein QL285_073024 [Trifolium repens]